MRYVSYSKLWFLARIHLINSSNVYSLEYKYTHLNTLISINIGYF